MSDYGRVPKMEIAPDPKEEEKEIFEVKEKEVSKEEVSKEDEKKIKLREHLAKCREKSAQVRAEKKAERIANKKPRGRPKKETNNDMSVKPIEPISTPEPKPPKEEEVFKQIPKEIPPQVETPNAPPSNAMFDMDMLLNKIDERMDTRFKNFQPPPQQYQPHYYPVPQFDEGKIREDERKKIKEERERKKQEILNQRTQQYYNKLPPVSYVNSDNPWDNLLNPKRYS